MAKKIKKTKSVEKKGIKKIQIIIPIIAFVFIILIDFGVIIFMKNKSIDSKEDLNKINTLYDKAEEEIRTFSSMRDEFYENKGNDFFLDSMKDRVEYWNSFIPKYKKEMDDISSNYPELIKLCKTTYVNQDANNKCNVFKKNYEMSNNYYVTDINLYLKFSNEYNKSLTKSDVKLNIIENKYKYIDVNEDNVYTGKTEGDTNE